MESMLFHKPIVYCINQNVLSLDESKGGNTHEPPHCIGCLVVDPEHAPPDPPPPPLPYPRPPYYDDPFFYNPWYPWAAPYYRPRPY